MSFLLTYLVGGRKEAPRTLTIIVPATSDKGEGRMR